VTPEPSTKLFLEGFFVGCNEAPGNTLEGDSVNRTEKEQFVEKLRSDFSAAKSLVLTSYQGISVNDINALRAQFRAKNCQYQIVKNTLARRALAGTEKEAVIDLLKGPVAIAYSHEDAITPAKLVRDFVKEQQDKFIVRGGYIDGSVLDADGVNALAKMATKPEMQSKLLGLFQAVPSKFLRTLQAGPQQFAMVLTARKQQLEEQA
jgi:large subunit ribosomal protein L10